MRGGAVPGPFYWTPFAAGRRLRADPLRFLEALHREYGDTVRLRMGPLVLYSLAHPDDVRRVLQEHHQNYAKGPIIARVQAVIGSGLFTSEGGFWRRQRRLAQPAFHRERIAGFAETMVRCTAARLDRWAPAVERGEAIDVAAEMSALALTIVGETLFGRDLSGEAAAAGRALGVALGAVAERVMSYLPAPLVLPTPRNRALRRAVGTLDALVYQIIDARRRSGWDGSDLLGTLLAARDAETGEAMTARQLRDEVMTFLLAGHETTAVALAWTWYLLARHPEVAARVQAEAAHVLGGRLPTVADLPQLPLCRHVVEEAMRLYPPVWGIGRQALGRDRLRDVTLPRGAIVNLALWVTHRHPEFWDEPARFDPERFRAERVRARPRFAYFPFSGGPRQCIGEGFALMEAQLVVAMVAQRYRLRLATDRAIEPEPTLTLRVRGGLPMRVEPLAPPATARAAG